VRGFGRNLVVALTQCILTCIVLKGGSIIQQKLIIVFVFDKKGNANMHVFTSNGVCLSLAM